MAALNKDGVSVRTLPLLGGNYRFRKMHDKGKYVPIRNFPNPVIALVSLRKMGIADDETLSLLIGTDARKLWIRIRRKDSDNPDLIKLLENGAPVGITALIAEPIKCPACGSHIVCVPCPACVIIAQDDAQDAIEDIPQGFMKEPVYKTPPTRGGYEYLQDFGDEEGELWAAWNLDNSEPTVLGVRSKAIRARQIFGDRIKRMTKQIRDHHEN